MENNQIICVHEGIVLKQLKGVMNVSNGERCTILGKEKNGTYIIGVDGIRCLLHSSFLNNSYVPDDDRFAYFKSTDKV